jgi:hypothetical protein
MTGEQFDAILKTAHFKADKADKDGWQTLSDGGTMTLYVAYHGASLTVARVEGIRVDGGLVYARTPKRELYALAKEDVYAVAIDGAAATGQPARRAGFG